MMKHCLFAIALGLAPLAAAQAVPADVAGAISAPGRPADAVALDAGRHPAETLGFGGLRRGDHALDLYTDTAYYGEIMARAVVHALHRIDPATVRADFERAGFVFDGESSLLRNPQDDHSKLVFDPAIRGHTDRVVYRFRRPR